LRLLRSDDQKICPAVLFCLAFLLTITFSVLLNPVARAQRGPQTASANLDYLVQRAGTIVRGHVISAKVESHPQFANLQTVVVTVAVSKVLKGTAPAAYTFRQFLLDSRDAGDVGGYRKTGELLLLLNPVSQYGLTSPVGVDQGRFCVVRDRQGKGIAVNGRSNIGLFDQLASKAAARGVSFSPRAQSMLAKPANQAPLDSLEDTIAALVGASQ
jgi:hypothetical protein